MKRFLTLIALLALVMALAAGCRNNDGPADVTDADDTPFVADAAGTADTEDDDPVEIDAGPTEVSTFTVLAGSGKSFDNPVAMAITEATGVRLEFDLIVGDADERINLITAAGQFPDIVMTPNISAMTTMIRANALVILDDYFDRYGPNLLYMYGPYLNRMRHSLEFPHIYGVGVGVWALGEGGRGRHWGEGFWVQNRALREQGFPEINTLQDFEAVIRTDLENNPYTADGLPRFGMTINATEGWRHIFSLTNMPQLLNGFNTGEFVLCHDTGEFMVSAHQDWYRDYMRWLNHMWNEGLIDPESFTQDYGTYQAKLSSGRVAGNIDAFWQFWPVIDEMVTSGRDDYAFMPFDIFADPSIRETRYRYDSVAGPGGFSITTAAGDVGKIVRFFDFLASEEGTVLKRWGIYGVNHTIGPDGLRVRVPQDLEDIINDHVEFQERTGVNYFTGGVNEWLCLPRGFITRNGICAIFQVEDFSVQAEMFGDVEREVLAAYGMEFFTDVFVCPSALPIFRYGGLSFPGSDDDFVIMAADRFSTMFFPGLVATIVAPREDFEAEWESFLAAIDATNVHLQLEHLNEQLEQRRELWGLN